MQTVSRELLLYQLETVQPGISPKGVIEQSSCFVFQDGQVYTFNDEVACASESCLDITGAVKADKLRDLLREMPEEEIEVGTEGERLVINGKGREAFVRMESQVLMPIDKLEKPKKWMPLHEEFGEAVNIVGQCAGKDESMFMTTCVHLTPKFLEAGGRYQAARYNLKTRVSERCLVRKESIKHVTGLDMTELSETPKWIHFRNPAGLRLSCRRSLDIQDYPDMADCYTGDGVKAYLPRDLGEAVKRASIFSADNADNDSVTVELRPGKLRISGHGAFGGYRERKNVKYKGREMSFLISPKLLIEITKTNNECEICKDKLIIRGGRFTYSAALGVLSKE